MDAKELRLECWKQVVSRAAEGSDERQVRDAARALYRFVSGAENLPPRDAKGRFMQIPEHDPTMPKPERASFIQRVFGE